MKSYRRIPTFDDLANRLLPSLFMFPATTAASLTINANQVAPPPAQGTTYPPITNEFATASDYTPEELLGIPVEQPSTVYPVSSLSPTQPVSPTVINDPLIVTGQEMTVSGLPPALPSIPNSTP